MRDLTANPIGVCIEEFMQGSEEERWSALIALGLTDEAVRQEVLKALVGDHVPQTGRSRIVFEPSFWGHARGLPDLGIDVMNGNAIEFTLLIENKIKYGTPLTKHQPIGYLEELRERHERQHVRGHITFVVPGGRRDAYRALVERKRDAYEHARHVDNFAGVNVVGHETLSQVMLAASSRATSEAAVAACRTYALLAALLFRQFKVAADEGRRPRLDRERPIAEAVVEECGRRCKARGIDVRKTPRPEKLGRIKYKGFNIEARGLLILCEDAGMAWSEGILWIQRRGTVAEIAPRWQCYDAVAFSRASKIAAWSGVMIPVDLTAHRSVAEIADWVMSVLEASPEAQAQETLA